MDNRFARQLVRSGHLGVAGLAPPAHPTLFGKLAAGSRMDGTADAAASRERFVRSIDNGAIREMEIGDIGADDANFSVDDCAGGEDGFRAWGELVGAVEE